MKTIVVVAVFLIVIVLILSWSRENFFYLRNKLFVKNDSPLDLSWRDQQLYPVNDFPEDMYSRKRFLGPGFYSTTGWQIEPRVGLKQDLPITGRWNHNSVEKAQKYYKLFY